MLISAENLSFGYAGNPLLENICFTLSEGDRVGLIGPNGEGKTTLLRLILSELEPESGKLFKKNGIRIGYLAQNGGYDSENTVFEEMRAVFSEDHPRAGIARPAGGGNFPYDGGYGGIPRPFFAVRGAQPPRGGAGQLSLRSAHPHGAQRHGLLGIFRPPHLYHVGRRKDPPQTLPAAA